MTRGNGRIWLDGVAREINSQLAQRGKGLQHKEVRAPVVERPQKHVSLAQLAKQARGKLRGGSLRSAPELS